MQFFWRVTATHTLSYFILGMVASYGFDYRQLFATEALRSFMVEIDSPQVAAGPALEVLRGLLFALVVA